MNTLTILAIVAQLSDAGMTCNALKNGKKELNPLLPQSCAGVIAIKSATLVPLIPLKGKAQKIYAGMMIGSGSIGITISLVKK